MSDEAGREIQGRTSPPHAACDLPADPDCQHDCQGCLTDFEQTQRQTEELRVELLHEHAENQRLWLEARTAMRQTLFDLVPQQRVLGMPGESAEFRAGWDRCREEIERRVQALMQVI